MNFRKMNNNFIEERLHILWKHVLFIYNLQKKIKELFQNRILRFCRLTRISNKFQTFPPRLESIVFRMRRNIKKKICLFDNIILNNQFSDFILASCPQPKCRILNTEQMFDVRQNRVPCADFISERI